MLLLNGALASHCRDMKFMPPLPYGKMSLYKAENIRYAPSYAIIRCTLFMYYKSFADAVV